MVARVHSSDSGFRVNLNCTVHWQARFRSSDSASARSRRQSARSRRQSYRRTSKHLLTLSGLSTKVLLRVLVAQRTHQNRCLVRSGYWIARKMYTRRPPRVTYAPSSQHKSTE
eukprot:376056-Rhodomonas_salina.1